MLQEIKPTCAFDGSEELKTQTIQTVKEKIQFNSLVKGSIPPPSDSSAAWFYGSLDESGYKVSLTDLGFPELLMYLENSIYKGLPQKQGGEFSLSFLEQTPVGADLTQIVDRFCHWMLSSEEAGMINYLEDETASHVKLVATFYELKIKGIYLRAEDWGHLSDQISKSMDVLEPVTDDPPTTHDFINHTIHDMENSEYAHRYDVLSVAVSHCFAHMPYLIRGAAMVAGSLFMKGDQYCSYPKQAQKLLDLLSDSTL